MVSVSDIKLERIDEARILIPRDQKLGMRVPGLIYVTEALEGTVISDQAIIQVVNVATLPGIVKYSFAMPDIHWGYGFPIGGVAATLYDEDGVISPGGIGFDINCGVRLLKTELSYDDVRDHLERLADILYRNVPSGVGSEGFMRLSNRELREVLKEGAKWVVKRGYAPTRDLEHIEEGGCSEFADPSTVSTTALDRGKEQLGTLGSGNHFLEVQVVEEIYDEDIARVMGLWLNQVTVMIHCGSRGLGHQVATDYVNLISKAMSKYGIRVPDKQLAAVPARSDEGQRYIGAMFAAANFAWANRELITYQVRQAFEEYFREDWEKLGIELIFDVTHNMASIEDYLLDGERVKLVMHRKGATRALPPGHPKVPKSYRDIGQPVLIPGDMGRYSYVLVGTERAYQENFGHTCHGAGRVKSRAKAKRTVKYDKLMSYMHERGIVLRAVSRKTVLEEAPEAYKDVADVVDTVVKAGLSKKVAKLRPLAVVKG